MSELTRLFSASLLGGISASVIWYGLGVESHLKKWLQYLPVNRREAELEAEMLKQAKETFKRHLLGSRDLQAPWKIGESAWTRLKVVVLRNRTFRLQD